MLKNLSKESILFVDDDELWLENTLRGLRILGLKGVEGCSNPLDVLGLLAQKDYALVLIDLWMPQKPGEILLSEIKQHYPDLPVVIITADNQIETAVKCMRSGAVNYLIKPIEPNQVIAHIRQIIGSRDSEKKANVITESPVDYHGMVTRSVSLKRIFSYLDTLVHSILPTLITGEVGVGKSRLARSIHRAYKRSGEFLEVDMAGVDQVDFFTGDTPGTLEYLLEHNRGASIYLKSCELLGGKAQEELLALFERMQEEYHSRIVNMQELPKFILSANMDIISEARVSADLSFVLKIQHVSVPSLRDRKQDIQLLAESFINEFVQVQGINTPYVPKELLPLLEQYQFPENVLELRHMFEDAVSRCKRGKLSLEPFKEHMVGRRGSSAEVEKNEIFRRCLVLPTLKEVQDLLIAEALERTGGNQAHAAHLLGITRQGLNRKLQSGGGRS